MKDFAGKGIFLLTVGTNKYILLLSNCLPYPFEVFLILFPNFSTGVSVTGRNISSYGILVVFEDGVGLTLKATEGAMSILLTAPESFLGQTQGLMGTWNDDESDDFLTPDGHILSSDLTTEELHYQFGLPCTIQFSNTCAHCSMGPAYQLREGTHSLEQFLLELRVIARKSQASKSRSLGGEGRYFCPTMHSTLSYILIIVRGVHVLSGRK